MLRFHILNVGQGDSIIIEHNDGKDRSFGLVDSNALAGSTPKALGRLHDLGAQELSFVCLTHPHRDHYRGLHQILKAYENRINQFIIFPAGEFLGRSIKKLASQYMQIAKTQDDPEITEASLEFVRILKHIRDVIGIENTLQYTGPDSKIPVKGFSNTDITCALPFPLMKGHYLERIRKNDETIFENEKENDLSIALVFRYCGVTVILGGDATHENWQTRLNWQNTRNLSTIHCLAAKLPHHGSRRDCTRETLDVVFGENDKTEKFAFISANGVKLPNEEVLKDLLNRGIKPYCTNLHTKCGANVRSLINTNGINPVLGKYINQISINSAQQACQGDIIFTVLHNGKHSIEREYKFPCGYRNELGDLFAV